MTPTLDDRQFARWLALVSGRPFDERPLDVQGHDFQCSFDGRHVVKRSCTGIRRGRPVYRVPAPSRPLVLLPRWHFEPGVPEAFDVV